MSATRLQRRKARDRLRRAVKKDTRRIARALVGEQEVDPRVARGRAMAMLQSAHAVAFLVYQMGGLR